MDLRNRKASTVWESLGNHASGLLLALDFDGTLSPIVDDPREAFIHPDAPALLRSLAAKIGALAIVTGRPAAQVLELGGFAALADDIEQLGSQFFIHGQYGNELWTSTEREVVSVPVPKGLAAFAAGLPALLASCNASDAWVEDKGLAVAVHTRRCVDPVAAFERLSGALAEAAHQHGLEVEPGRLVIEVRAPGMDKGQALRKLVQRTSARAVVFVGDDLGDVPAFEELARLAEEGLPTLGVCSGSTEEATLLSVADAVVPGPAGVVEFLSTLNDLVSR